MKPSLLGSLVLALMFAAMRAQAAAECVDSPGKVLQVCVFVENGGAFYEVSRRGRPVLEKSALGLKFTGEEPAWIVATGEDARESVDMTWEQPWGEERTVRDRHNELRIALRGDTPMTRTFDVVVRAFDDGFGLRYDYHGIAADRLVEVAEEFTQFRPVGKYEAWWFEAYQKERDEYLYRRTPLDAVSKAETPLTLESPGLYLSIHEAALVDFASMTLSRTGSNTLQADLMPWSDGVKVRLRGPFKTPWRTVLVTETPAQLADSRLELNLNEPNRLGDVSSYARPGKYVGIWWEMHLNRSTWASGAAHGATTANAKRYIDFAAKYGFGGVLVEGWNTGWDGDWIANGRDFNFTKPYPDFDLAAVASYAAGKGVSLIGHNETAGAIANYEAQMEAGFTQYAKHGVHAVKTGYVKPNGTIERATEEGVAHEWFAGQYMVAHHQRVAELAAKHAIALDAHEPVKDTGLRRTYPNMMSREGARGQEFNAWGVPTNPPEHVVILPFTRLLAGPMDFTPGIFDIEEGKSDVSRRVQSTLANQLALYVVIYSPLHMAADLPENYERHLDAFQFIRDVPTDWERSRTVDARIGDYIVVARQQRDRADWYLGALTDERPRTLPVALDFLAPGRRYEAQIYRDAPDADYRTKPLAYVIDRRTVTSKDTIVLALAPGGGTAIRFKALD